jgi:hypothetical protein
MKKFLQLACVTAIASVSLSAHAADKAKLDGRIQEARTILREIMATPDKGIPLDITQKARCVAVIPGFKKAIPPTDGALQHSSRSQAQASVCRLADSPPTSS